MSKALYTDDEEKSSSFYASANNVTIARALSGKLLTKTIYANSEKAYDNAFHYQFFNRNVYCLSDLLELVRVLLAKPQCCIIRGVCKDDTLNKQRRVFHGDEATIIEQSQNWYALDVDEFGESSGNLKEDAKRVLLALNMPDVEAFAIPSSGYLRKPGIRIRLFLWNNSKVSCLTLKKYFDKIGVVDTALFHPIQPIYIARPIFSSGSDPCNTLVAWMSGNQHSEIHETFSPGAGRKEELYTRKQAERYFSSFLQEVFDIRELHRHKWLINKAIALGKWIWQDLLVEEDVIDELYLATAVWHGNRKRDMETILDGIKRGKQKMEENENDF